MDKCVELSISELNRIFQEFNKHYFDNDLESPVILVQSNGKNRNALGWFTTKRIWVNKQTGETRFEITVAAEFLSRTIIDVAGTMLHEMIHLYCEVNNIKDTSNGNVYHNKKYRDEAERHGLICEKAPVFGYAFTKPNDEAKDFIASINVDEKAFLWTRNNMLALLDADNANDDGKDTKPKKPRKKANVYICNGCEAEIKSKKEIHATCVDCNQPFEKVEEEQDNPSTDTSEDITSEDDVND